MATKKPMPRVRRKARVPTRRRKHVVSPVSTAQARLRLSDSARELMGRVRALLKEMDERDRRVDDGLPVEIRDVYFNTGGLKTQLAVPLYPPTIVGRKVHLVVCWTCREVLGGYDTYNKAESRRHKVMNQEVDSHAGCKIENTWVKVLG